MFYENGREGRMLLVLSIIFEQITIIFPGQKLDGRICSST